MFLCILMKSTRWTNIVLNEKCMCWCFIDYLPIISWILLLANGVAENMVLVSKKARHQQMHKPLSEGDKILKKTYVYYHV